MLRDKGTTTFSELNNFFTSSEKVIGTILSFSRSLTFSDNKFGFSQATNKKYSNRSKLLLLLLFPLFEVKTSWHYANSVLYHHFSCGKDVFYRLLNDLNINWRAFSYSITMQVIRNVEKKSTPKAGSSRCLIIDDTDMPKTGWCIELIGRIFSHVTHTYNIGFKGLFMGYHDGTSLSMLDFSLHGEKGKNEKKPYGLTPQQTKDRYSKKRDKASSGNQRKEEYFTTKIASAIQMIRLAITKGVRFDYLLCDSWFTCFELIQFIASRRIKCYFLGMIKMSKTKYELLGKSLSANQIVDHLRKKREVKHSKHPKCYYCEAIVKFKGIPVKLLFCKTSKKGTWKGMMSTNTAITFEQAYKIYATRWTIEVFFKEAKQHLQLGKCQSQDFDAQIASTTLSILQYNILSAIKRFENYETFGDLFRASQKNTLELTIAERIWLIVKELIPILSEYADVDTEMLMQKLCSDNETIKKLQNFNCLLQAG